MPRHARIDIPGLLQHVIVRGIEKGIIFLDDQDREEILLRLSKLLQETETDCYAWALLNNHFHLLLRPRKQKLADIMRRLLTGYAVVFNLRHNRTGHLFQNRYKSIVCDKDSYLQELVRYIHLNPVRAGIVKDLDALMTFPWCGHAELLGKSSRSLLHSDEILAFFAPGRRTAQRKYHSFIADGFGQDPPAKLSRGGKRTSRMLDPFLAADLMFDDRILGGGQFVEKVLGPMPTESRLSFSDLTTNVAEYFRIEPSTLRLPSKERNIAQAKAVLCHVAVRHLGIKGIEVAEQLSYSPTAVSQAAKRGNSILAADKSLKGRIEQAIKL